MGYYLFGHANHLDAQVLVRHAQVLVHDRNFTAEKQRTPRKIFTTKTLSHQR